MNRISWRHIFHTHLWVDICVRTHTLEGNYRLSDLRNTFGIKVDLHSYWCHRTGARRDAVGQPWVLQPFQCNLCHHFRKLISDTSPSHATLFWTRSLRFEYRAVSTAYATDIALPDRLRPGLIWNAFFEYCDFQKKTKKFGPFLDLCVSSLRRGHANLLCIVPILSDVSEETDFTLSFQHIKSFF
jgi:hypothetical protein